MIELIFTHLDVIIAHLDEIIADYGNMICTLCIGIMQCGSSYYGISYGLLNVLLFVIFQPLSILFFFISSVTGGKIKKGALGFGILFVSVDIITILLCMYPFALGVASIYPN